MKKLLLFAGAGLIMVGCSEAPTAPAASRRAPTTQPSNDEITCRSGYVIAYDENGNPYCAPAPGGQTQTSASKPLPSPSTP